MSENTIIDLYYKENNPSLLLAFPFAGASAQVFDSFKHHLPIGFNLSAIQYPGRGVLINKPLIYKIDDMINFLQKDIIDCFAHYQNIWIYGHSLGALIAYEMLTFFHKNKWSIEHCTLNIGACPPPSQIQTNKKIHHLPDNEFLTQLVKSNGLQKEFTSNKSLMEMYLPILRADFTIYETYQTFAQE